MEEQVKITVITSTYQNETTLARTIESVLAQSFTDFEYILVNHGSTDGTAQVIERYQEKDKRIKGITMEENQGFIGKAINQGIAAAQGQYLCFIDGDDVYLPDYLQFLYTAVREKDYDLGICGSSRVYEDGREFLVDTIQEPISLLSPEDYKAFPKIIEETPTRYFTVWWNKIFKKSYLEGIQRTFPEDTLVHGDAIFLLGLYQQFPKMFCGDYVGIQWTQQTKSTSFGTYRPAYFEEMMEVVSLYRKLYEILEATPEEEKALAHKLLTTVVNTKRLEHSKENPAAEERRWKAHPLYQWLEEKKGEKG